NGVTFFSSGNLTSTGSQNIVLTAQGIPTTGDLITFGFDLVATCSFTLPVGGIVAAGSTFTTFSNGTANFSTNSTCTTSNISAGHNSNSCTGTVNGASTTYNLVLINGQCWMKENLKETPTLPCADAINTGCNTWNATSVTSDFGYWGYYNISNSTGSAGWSSTETITNGGLIYQWSAAMNGETTERARGVCPIGFHIPSDCEWMYLEHGLGMSISDQQATGARASGSVGIKISNVVTGGTNSSGFTALLAGNRNTTGNFANHNAVGVYWTSTTSSTNSFRRFFQSTYSGSNRGATVRHSTASVRCLKD
ncbi:MAG: fibrobacter succinogenes major paralogous domain-containing protein, partial [Dolichospermum sp.]